MAGNHEKAHKEKDLYCYSDCFSGVRRGPVSYTHLLVDFFTGVKNKACCCKNKVINDEYSDFADV